MDYETQEGKTALLVAIDLENVDAISALVKSRADLNHQTSKAVTPLVAAARDEKAKSLAALILHGAGLFHSPPRSHTPPPSLVSFNPRHQSPERMT